MDSHWGTPNHRKRKRRRGPDRPPLAAQLVLDGRLKGDVGVLSEDLFGDLFPALASSQDPPSNNAAENAVNYVAITPNAPASHIYADSVPWTFLAIKKPSADGSSTKQLPRSTIHVSANSNAVQSFARALQKSSPNKALPSRQSTFDIQVLDVVPIKLDTIAVSIDETALRKLDKANRDYHHGHAHKHGPMKRTKSTERHGSLERTKSASEDDVDLTGEWDAAIRAAIGAHRIVHFEDHLPLPLPSHPITHVSPPPAIVEFCEPVSQGVVSPSTKIVVISSVTKAKRPVSAASSVYASSFSSLSNGSVEEEAEDTSNEQFFSAAEDRPASSPPSPAPSKPISVQAQPLQNDSADVESTDDDTDLSDGEADTIGLSLPTLPTHSSGLLSSFSSATPKAAHLYSNGVATPGSVISTFSTSTIRGGGTKGRLFEAQGLLFKVPDEALHPKPRADEDDEARVFVDTTALVKLGCFSGDWIRVEASFEGGMTSLGSLGIGAFGTHDLQDSRIAKIYGIPGLAPRRPRYAINRSGARRFSNPMMGLEKSQLKVYMSPIALANLGNPPSVRIASIMTPQGRRGSKQIMNPNAITNLSSPPSAKEVTILKYTTPLATEKSLQSSLFVTLRQFFESKRRVVKTGDLIGIPVDDDLGRATYQQSTQEDENEQDELLPTADGNSETRGGSSTPEIAWFKVGAVIADANNQDNGVDDESPWEQMAVVQPGSTRMVQAGSQQGKLPEASKSTWQYYLGAKRLPPLGQSALSQTEQLIEPPRPYVSLTRRRLRELISAATSPQALHLGLPPIAILLTSTQRQIGKETIAKNACADLGLHTFAIDAYDIMSEGGGADTKMELLLKARVDRGLACGAEFTAIVIKNIEVLNAGGMASVMEEILADSRVLIATSTEIEKVAEGVRGIFTHEIELSAPDEGEREGLLRDIVQDVGVPIANDVDLSSVAIKTAALVAGDLLDVVDRTIVARRDRLEQLARTASQADQQLATVKDIQLAGGESSRCVVKADFDIAVEAARKNFADAIGAPKIPNVGWEDVGGLTNVKDAVLETIQLPLERPELFAKGMKKRSGILFYGPPGTGKTLLAKAIATEFSLNFFSVKGPELLNMYIGESEANVRRVFQRARDARPCVVFFDELDSVAPKRGNQGDSGGVMDRIVSQLLAELDGMSSGEEGSGGVFVIGATNRPDLLDQALLRPGRFDKMLYLGVSDTHDKQLTILEALTRKFALHPSLSLANVAAQLPFTYTGADLYALCSDAMLKAITRRASAVDARIRSINAERSTPISTAYFFDHFAAADDTDVVVEQADFDAAARELVPSVSAKELQHYERVKRVFESGEERPDVLVDRPQMRVQSPQGPGVDGVVDEEDFVLRTGGLSLDDGDGAHGRMNGTAGAVTKGKGKGKGRPELSDQGYGFGSSTEDDDSLYVDKFFDN